MNEVPHEAPIVCRVGSFGGQINIGEAITNILTGLPDPHDVMLTPGTPEPVIASAPQRIPRVNLKVQNDLAFEATFSCPEGTEGETFRIPFTARTDFRTFGRLTTTVVCRTPISSSARPPRIPLPLVAAVPPLFPRLPQQFPSNVAQPNSQIQSQMNTQSQAQAQGAAAVQRQQQPQVALVHAAKAVKEQIAMEHNMVKVRSNGRLEAIRLTVAAGSVSMIFLYGFVLAAARSVQRTHVHKWNR